MSRIFIISGPSGSGKTTLVKDLLKNQAVKNKLVKSVSLTTRPRRSGERKGRDYFFISEKEFSQLRKAKKILEWTCYLGYYYATPKDFIEKKLAEGKSLVLCLDLKGALKIKGAYPKDTITIFIVPPSLKALRQRIEKRCDKTRKKEIRERLKYARREILAARRYDYCLVNKNLVDTVKELKNIVLREIEVRTGDG